MIVTLQGSPYLPAAHLRYVFGVEIRAKFPLFFIMGIRDYWLVKPGEETFTSQNSKFPLSLTGLVSTLLICGLFWRQSFLDKFPFRDLMSLKQLYQ